MAYKSKTGLERPKNKFSVKVMGKRIIASIRGFWDGILKLKRVEERKKLWNKIKIYLTFKMLLTFGTVWILTTGWSYVFIVVGASNDIDWMVKLGTGAQFFFWNPLVNEKLVTIPFSIWLHKKIFGHAPDEG